MDGSGPLVADWPRRAASARAPRRAPMHCPDEAQLIARLLTPAQRLKYSLIPGSIYGWIRALRRWRLAEPELTLLAGLVDSHRTAVDVGANKGTDTWFLSRLCRHVYAYEPNPAMRWMLTRSTPRNVTVFSRALSDRAGEGILRIPRRHGRPANSIGTLRPIFDDVDCEEVAVTMSRLDDDGLADVGFLKIDIEGCEQEVLRGAREVIARDRPVLLVRMADDRNDAVDDTIEFISQFGYRAHLIQGARLQEWSPPRDRQRHRSQPHPAIRSYVFLPAAGEMARAA